MTGIKNEDMSNEVKNKIKNELTELKRKEKLTVQEIADRFGYSHSQVWKMLHGWVPVSKRIKAFLGTL